MTKETYSRRPFDCNSDKDLYSNVTYFMKSFLDTPHLPFHIHFLTLFFSLSLTFITTYHIIYSTYLALPNIVYIYLFILFLTSPY